MRPEKATSSTFMAGEALAYVKGFGPKASAVVYKGGLSTPRSPDEILLVTHNKTWFQDGFWGEDR